MHRLLPILCFLLSLAMLIAGFTLMAIEAPDVSVELHQAYAQNDQSRQDTLEAALQRKQLTRKVLIGSLFGGSVIMVVTAFLAMTPRHSQGLKAEV